MTCSQVARVVRAGAPGKSEARGHLASSVFTTFAGVRPAEPCSVSVAATHQLLTQLRESGDLQPGDVAGGRAAAAYARITGQALPRGDLMRFLECTEAAKHAALATLFAATDSLIGALEGAPALASHLHGWTALQREEVQLTCYPGEGTIVSQRAEEAV